MGKRGIFPEDGLLKMGMHAESPHQGGLCSREEILEKAWRSQSDGSADSFVCFDQQSLPAAWDEHPSFMEADAIRHSAESGNGPFRNRFRQVRVESVKMNTSVSPVRERCKIAASGRHSVASFRGADNHLFRFLRMKKEESIVLRVHQEASLHRRDSLSLTGKVPPIVENLNRSAARKIVPGNSAVGPDHRHKMIEFMFGEGVSVKLSAVEMAEGKARSCGIGDIEESQDSPASPADGKTAVVRKMEQLKNDSAPFPASDLPESVLQGIDGKSIEAFGGVEQSVANGDVIGTSHGKSSCFPEFIAF